MANRATVTKEFIFALRNGFQQIIDRGQLLHLKENKDIREHVENFTHNAHRVFGFMSKIPKDIAGKLEDELTQLVKISNLNPPSGQTDEDFAVRAVYSAITEAANKAGFDLTPFRPRPVEEDMPERKNVVVLFPSGEPKQG
jgi:hypothetical protein